MLGLLRSNDAFEYAKMVFKSFFSFWGYRVTGIGFIVFGVYWWVLWEKNFCWLLFGVLFRDRVILFFGVLVTVR